MDEVETQLPASIFMALSLPFFALLFLLFLCMVFAVMKKGMRPREVKKAVPRLPPGPRKLPIIGSLHHMVKFKQHPHQTLRDLAKKHGPLMHMQLGEVPFVVVASAEAAREVMKTHDQNFADRPAMPTMKYHTYGYKDIALAPYGPYWRMVRKICVLELLTAKRVESFRHIREEETSNMVKAIFASVGTTPVNLNSIVYPLINNIVAREAFGDRNKHQEVFLSTVKELVKAQSGGFNLTELFPSSRFIHVVSGMKFRLEQITRKFDRIFSDIIEERRLKSTKAGNEGRKEYVEDLVDVLLRLQQHGDLDVPFEVDNIKAVIMDMFVAGSDTSSVVMIWAMAELMRNPKVMAKAQEEVRQALGVGAKVAEADIQELKYLELVIKETLRLHPPAPLLVPRESRHNCKVMGYEIPANTRVLVNAWAIARDPNNWGEDPESFRPERFLDVSYDYRGTNFEFLPFGAGRRMCPGMTLGLANIELPLAALLYYFNWELPGGMEPKDLDMAEEFGAIVSLKSDLYLLPVPYN